MASLIDAVCPSHDMFVLLAKWKHAHMRTRNMALKYPHEGQRGKTPVSLNFNFI